MTTAPQENTGASSYFAANDLHAYYGESYIVQGISLNLNEGEILALLGRNGAGKTSTLRSIARLDDPALIQGEVWLNGQALHLMKSYQAAQLGVGLVPEDRRIIQGLTVEENLLTGSFTRSASRSEINDDLELVYNYFPRLKERRKSQAGYTSGGEQQMCAIGRALMSRPETILLDEPSMGLAPQLVEEIFGIVKDLNEKEGVSFLLAEQNTNIALRFAHYGYILENGRVVMDGPAQQLRENPDVKEFYLGMSDEGRKSFRDVRSYRRRKRWLS